LYVYRYFKHELLAKKAIAKADLPVFLESWMDRNSDMCMFSMPQLKTWTSTHLKGVGWYLDCVLGYVHADEKDLKSSAETADKPALLDGELENLDEEARLKLIAKVEAADKKKAMKIIEQQKKLAAREQAKIDRAAEKIAKEEKKKNPKVKEIPKPSASSIVDAESQRQSQEQRGTKRDSGYLELSQAIVPYCGQVQEFHDLGEDHEIDELILNTSLGAALPQNGDNPLPTMFVEIQNFLGQA
jgi:hypothetical protein